VNKFKDILSRAVGPALNMNLLAMVIGAIWLVISSQWLVILPAFFALMLSSTLIPIFLSPVRILTYFMVNYQQKNSFIKERLMLLLAFSYIVIFITLWSSVIFQFIISGVNINYLVPALIFGTSSAIAPLFLWVKRDKTNIFALMSVYAAELAILILVILKLLIPNTGFLFTLTIILGVITLVLTLEWIFDR